MKKQLLIGSALLLTLSTYSQQNKKQVLKPCGVVNLAEIMRAKYAIVNSANAEKPVNLVGKSSNPSPNLSLNNENNGNATTSSNPIISASFARFSGSSNVFGMLVSNSKPLQYNRYLRAFSFIQRKSATYVTNPVLPAAAQSGAIVMYIGKNDAATWDSTLIYSDANNWSRYPSGALYTPVGSTNIAQAYAVGSGPVTQANTTLGWIGSWRASKLIGAAGTNSVGTDVQFFANSGNYGSTTSPAMTKHDFPRLSFSSTEDGVVRVAGQLCTNVNINPYAYLGLGFRGTHISKGMFTSGAMVWTSDSMVPQFIHRTDGSVQADVNNAYMAWNDAGTVGYVMMLGARFGATLQNKAWQPIVYKTTNSGNSWALINGIDFNTGTAYDKLLNSMVGVNNTSVTAPYFNSSNGIDMVVDNNNKLHIVGTAVGAASPHQDSLEYSWQFTPNGQPTSEKYSWGYRATEWPYLFDFTGDGSAAWTMTIVDSLGTEGPSATSGYPGFGSNPWADQSQMFPTSSDDRIQVSRSYDGQFMIYSWAESDTTLTTNSLKWNEFPNVHQRALRLCDGAVSTDEFIVSSPGAGFNARVRDKAYFHYMGSTCKAGGSTLTQATFTVPYTVSNNLTTDGGASVDNFYSNVVVTHNFPSSACGATITTGISAAKTEASQSLVYPNPTKNNINVVINLTQAKDISVDVYNAIGQMISNVKSNGQMGENVINVNLNNTSAGVYFVKIKAGNSESTKKLIVE